ncbi:hypothetical protein BJ138DRAFT_1011444, partial [Hygrophoropsis aurantiaca]
MNPLPAEIKVLLKTAKKYKLSFAPIKMHETLKEKMPAWLHVGAQPQTYHWTKDECLRENHRVMKIADLIKITHRLDRQNTTINKHSPRTNCKCSDCKNDRTIKCKNPHKCAENAKHILERIAPKMSNKSIAPKDNLTLTHRRREKNEQAIEAGGGEMIFDPSVTSQGLLKECFRLF